MSMSRRAFHILDHNHHGLIAVRELDAAQDGEFGLCRHDFPFFVLNSHTKHTVGAFVNEASRTSPGASTRRLVSRDTVLAAFEAILKASHNQAKEDQDNCDGNANPDAFPKRC